MGQDESLPELPFDESIIIINDENETQIPYVIQDPNKIKFLNISKAQMKKIGIDMPNLTTVCYNYAKLETVPPCVIDLMEKSAKLESLDFSFNELTSFPADAINKQGLKHLSLFQNKLQNVVISKATSFSIDLGVNELTSIPRVSNDVRDLSLDNNKITSVQKSMPKLQRLSLHNNMIDSFSDVSFAHLRVIDLSYNKITKLPELKKTFPIIRYLDISHNSIEALTDMPTSLEEINASFNLIKEIPESIKGVSLKVANFSSNLLEYVPVLPEKLHFLNVSNNKIVKFEASKLPKLCSLFLKRNLLRKIPKLYETRVTDISFASNLLTSMKVNHLLHNITTLDLSDNRLNEIPEVIINLPHLLFFSAARNYLKTAPESIKDSHLISLNLSQNPIESLPKLPSTLERLILIHCNLKNADFYDEDNEELIELFVAGNVLEAVKFLPWFQSVNVSRNSFKEFPKINDGLKYLDMSCNLLTNVGEISSRSLEYLDLSYNHVSSISLATPKIETFKINGNIELSCAIRAIELPELKHVELVNCPNFVLDITNCHINHILADKLLNVKTILYDSPPKASAITCIKGDNTASEDVCTFIKKIRNDVDMLCIFDGTSTHKSAVLATRTAINAFDKKNANYMKHPLPTLSNRVANTIDEQRNFDMREMCFVFMSKSKITIDVIGLITVYVLSGTGKIRKIIRGEEKDEFGPLSVSTAVSRPIVFGYVKKVCNIEEKLQDDDKWILTTSSNFANIVPNDVIEFIAERSSEARKFAYDLRNLAFSYSQKLNISVAVVDLKLL